jgi:hypothetical protein
MEFQEYPKSLYWPGWEDLSATIVVNDKDEEKKARKSGFKMMAEFGSPAEVTPDPSKD